MRDLAKISRIDNLEPIAKKDRIELATVENYTVIVKKGEFKVGDLCVYVFYDTVLPKIKQFEFLGANCYSVLYDGYRIKNMKMAGVYSSGIVFPISIVDKKYRKYGKDVTKALGVVRYDPEEKRDELAKVKRPVFDWLMRYEILNKFYYKFNPKKKKFTKCYPSTVRKSNESNIEQVFNKLIKKNKDDLFYLTEKMEGSAGTWLLINEKGETVYKQFSHNVYKSPDIASEWTTVGNDNKLEMKLRNYKEKTGVNLAIQGEVCGPKLQSNIYGFEKVRLFVYKVTDVDTGKAFNYSELIEFCKQNDLETVPVLGTSKLLDNVDLMLEHCEGNSVFKKKNNPVKREGVVWRSTSNQDVGCKCKSRDYQAWYCKKFDETK